MRLHHRARLREIGRHIAGHFTRGFGHPDMAEPPAMARHACPSSGA